MKVRTITRTIKTHNVKVFYANLDTKQIEETSMTIVGDYKDNELEKIVKVRFTEEEKGNVKYLSMEIISTSENLYEMTEEMFYNISIAQ